MKIQRRAPLGQFPWKIPELGKCSGRLHVERVFRHVLWGAMVGYVCCTGSLWDQSRFQWEKRMENHLQKMEPDFPMLILWLVDVS